MNDNEIKQEYEEQVANCYFCPDKPRNKTDRLCVFVGLPDTFQVPVCLACTKLMEERKHPHTRNIVRKVMFKLSH